MEKGERGGDVLEELFLVTEAKESEGEVNQLKPILQPGGNETDQHGLQERTRGGVAKVGHNLTQRLVRQEGTSYVDENNVQAFCCESLITRTGINHIISIIKSLTQWLLSWLLQKIGGKVICYQLEFGK